MEELKYVDEKILKSNNDDTCYAMLEWLNGYIPQECKFYDTVELAKGYNYNEVEPSGKLNRYIKKGDLLNLHIERIREVAGTDYNNAFNFYNRDNFHHIIIPFRSWCRTFIEHIQGICYIGHIKTAEIQFFQHIALQEHT